MITKATVQDLDVLHKFFQNVTAWVQERGFHHWDDYYTKERIETNLKTGEVYLFYFDDELVGTICLQDDPHNDYWVGLPKRHAAYFSALAILPKYHKHGYARELILFLIDRARELGYEWLRFDVLGNWQELNDFYVRLGAKKVGEVGDRTKNFGILYEKELI